MKKFSITFLNEPNREPLVLEADKVQEKDGRYSFYKKAADPEAPDELVGAFVNINFSEHVAPVETEGKAAAAASEESEA